VARFLPRAGSGCVVPQLQDVRRISDALFKRDQVAEVDVLNGWFWAARRDALDQVDSWTKRFLCMERILIGAYAFGRPAGRSSISQCESIHYGGASSSKAPLRFYLEMQKANYQYWQKHYGGRPKLCICPLRGLTMSCGWQDIRSCLFWARSGRKPLTKRSAAGPAWSGLWESATEVEAMHDE